jgi:hypothetical protein
MPKLFTPSSNDLVRMVDTAMSKFDQSQSLRKTFPNLVKYVETKNAWEKACHQGGRPGSPGVFDLYHFTNRDKARLTMDLECDLSPENLCCDGELSGPALRQKAQYLNAVKTELEAFVCL